MSTITRAWLAFAAIGTGLIHVALVIGSPLALAIPLALLGLAEFGWGALAFARNIVPVPRIAIVVAVLPIVLWGLLLVTSNVDATPAAAVGIVPLGVATLFELFITGMLALHLRRPASTTPAVPGVTRYLLGLVMGALVVTALVTPAVAATQAASYVPPAGTDLFENSKHGGH